MRYINPRFTYLLIYLLMSWAVSDPMTHDDEITTQQFAIFLFLVDLNKLLTHSIIIAGGLILIYDFFAPKTKRVVQYHHVTPPLSPMRRTK